MTIDLLKQITNQHSGSQEEIDQNSVFWGNTLSGKGKLEFKNGNVYEGNLLDGWMHGKGLLEWKNGVKFEGDFKKNFISGEGEYIWPDGSWYKGEVLNSLRHGKGEFKSEVNNVEYVGEWEKGLKHGKGKLVYKQKEGSQYTTDAVYEGEFKFGFKHGKGVMKYPSGNTYTGYYKYDKKSGYGEMNWYSKQETYKGFWEDDKQNGFGEHLWLEDPGKSKSLRNRYEGMFFNGKRHGYGCFYYSDGTRYEGEWVNNKKEGFGLFMDATGDMIEAIFKSDRLLKRLNQPKTFKIIQFVSEATEGSDDSSPDQNIKGRNRRSKKPEGKTRGLRSAIPSRGRNKKKKPKKDVEKEKSKRAHTAFKKRNQVNEISNPYVKILRVDDLLASFQGRRKEKILSNLEIVMLRYNRMFVELYKRYRKREENITHYSFTMKQKVFWKFLRKSKLLTPTLTLAKFNNEYFKNAFNQYEMHFNYDKLREKIKNLKLKYFGDVERKMDMLKKLDVYLRNHYVKVENPKIDYNNFEKSLEDIQVMAEDMYEKDLLAEKAHHNIEYMDRKKFSIHDPDNVVLFRNFIDGIIRAIYIRENESFVNIDSAIEKYVIYRIRPLVFEGKEMFDCPFTKEQEEKLEHLMIYFKVDEDEELAGIYERNIKLRALGCYDSSNNLMDVKGMHDLLKRAGVLNGEEDRLLLFDIVERNMDPDSTYMQARKDYLVRLPILLGDEDSIDLKSDFNDNSHIFRDSKLMTKNNSVSNGEIDKMEQNNSIEDDHSGASIHQNEDGEDESNNENNEQDELFKEQLRSYRERELRDKKGLIGDENRDLDFEEKRKREQFYDKELAAALQRLLGCEILFFEFVENLVMFCLQKVTKLFPNTILGYVEGNEF